MWRGFLFSGMTRRVYLFEDGMGGVCVWRMVPSFTLPGEWPPKRGGEFRVEYLLLGAGGPKGRFGAVFKTPPRLVAFDRFRRLYVMMSSQEVLLPPMAPFWRRERLRRLVRLSGGREVGFPFIWRPGSVSLHSFSQRPPNPCLVMEDGILLADGGRKGCFSLISLGPIYFNRKRTRAFVEGGLSPSTFRGMLLISPLPRGTERWANFSNCGRTWSPRATSPRR